MPIFKRGKPSGVVGSAARGGGDVEARVREIGLEYLELARKNRFGLLSRAFWSDKLMDWAMKDHEFKVQLFRFVDAFPVLRHDPRLVHEVLADYLSQPGVKLPPGLELGMSASGLAKGALTKTVSGQIEGMAKKFIAGTDAASALPGLERLWKSGIAFSVDLLGEACVSDAEADEYLQKYLDLVSNLPKTASAWKANETLETDHLGPIPRCNVSIKISSLSAREDPIDSEGAIRDLMGRIVPILEAARDNDVLINFDMESFHVKDLTLELFKRCCEAVDFTAGLAMQAYLKSGDEDARNISDWARATGRQVTVRLVKGAYWDYETIHAEEMGWPCPVWNTKPETDACFERMTRTFLDATPRDGGEGGVKLAAGSHNARSIAVALAELEKRDLPRNALELQMLHGMADQLKGAATEMGLRLREYVPIGEMIPGMAYLVRRLLENTSNESWLKAGFLDEADPEVLLADPAAVVAGASGNGSAQGAHVLEDVGVGTRKDLYLQAPERHQLSPAVEGLGDGRPFHTEPLRDFSDGAQREAFARAIHAARVPHVEIRATDADARSAVDEAVSVFPAWRDADPMLRARVLVRAAEMFRQRRDELSGVIIKENGKGWRDADADVTEAIDFLEYYARCAVPLFRRERLGRYIGELDETWYQPRGVAAVIAPWNFPLAIACGMASAALVCGNTVVLKPAEQTPGIAEVLAETMWAALEAECKGTALEGQSRSLFGFVAGPGETAGAELVRDPRVALLAFTGSKAVGLDIIRAAGVTHEQQLHVKKVVCEMGGKNAVIVDSSADLDEAVLHIRQSAFGFQGQKCSACSRVIVVDPAGADGTIMTTFLRRFVEATRSLVVKNPLAPGSDVGPVIDGEAFAKITSMIEGAKAEGCRVELELGVPEGAHVLEDVGVGEAHGLQSVGVDGAGGGVVPDNYVGPTIFSGVTTEHTIWRDEIFGPVVAVTHAETFERALDLANGSAYKLTGGVFSRKPEHLEKAKREFRVGNLYLNRGCTGALVARQPFGGFGMSGVGSKAGGADYLLQFVEPRASCENTMRRGFAPEL